MREVLRRRLEEGRRGKREVPPPSISGLRTVPISEAAATQRAGRAGRVAAGVALRMWSEGEKLESHTPPSITLADLSSAALQLAACGFSNGAAVESLCWLDPPRPSSLLEAHSVLLALGALRNATVGGMSSHTTAFQ